MHLVNALEGEVKAWVNQGWTGVTQTTLELFNYWFSRGEDEPERFYDYQKGLGFKALIPLCQGLRDRVIAQAQGTLFV